MNVVAEFIGWIILGILGIFGLGVAIVVLRFVIPGRLLCKMGVHKLYDSWCQREGCHYHQNNF